MSAKSSKRQRSRVAPRNAHSTHLPSGDTNQTILTAIDFLAREIEREESHSEQRVTFFLSLSTAAVAIIGVLYQFGPRDQIDFFTVLVSTLGVLLLFGWSTVNRLNSRAVYNRINTDLIKKASESISKGQPPFKEVWDDRKKAEALIDQSGWFRKTFRGTLAEFMYFANALIVIGIVVAYSRHVQWSIPVTVLIGIAVWTGSVYLQSLYSKWMRNAIPEKWNEVNRS